MNSGISYLFAAPTATILSYTLSVSSKFVQSRIGVGLLTFLTIIELLEKYLSSQEVGWPCDNTFSNVPTLSTMDVFLNKYNASPSPPLNATTPFWFGQDIFLTVDGIFEIKVFSACAWYRIIVSLFFKISVASNPSFPLAFVPLISHEFDPIPLF